MLWTEKYRPKTHEEFHCPEYLQKFLISGSGQHLLLYGPPGSGKTTFAHLIASKDFLELNASDERGINVVRNKIKTYASGINKQKTIILDECESLTNDAQQCLRRVIEDFSSTTRFIFITNYLSKVISPLKSRLFKIRFQSKPENYIYLKNVGLQNGINKDDAFYQNLFIKSNFDLRRSLNILQGIAPFINEVEEIDEYVGIIPDIIIENFSGLKKDGIKEFVDIFMRSSYGFLQFLFQLSEFEMCDEMKCEFSLVLSELEKRCIMGCLTEIMLHFLCNKKCDIWN